MKALYRNFLKSINFDFALGGLIVVVTFFTISLNGGIVIGFSNHTGLVPVVRRILDPTYLPNDFSILLREYHHRFFAMLLAAASWIFGETNALVVFNVFGRMLLMASLAHLCRTLQLKRRYFFVLGLFIAFQRVAWIGRGLEINDFLGHAYIMPTTFAHALILLALVEFIKGRYRHVAVFSGAVVLFHVQIGFVFSLIFLVLFILHGKKRVTSIDFREISICIGLWVLTSALALWHFVKMLQRGLLAFQGSSPFVQLSLAYHMNILSKWAVAWIAAHVFVQFAVLKWGVVAKPRTKSQTLQKEGLGLLWSITLILGAFTIIHLLGLRFDPSGAVTSVQFLRLSFFITVFGGVSAMVLASFLEKRVGIIPVFAGFVILAFVWLLPRGMNLDLEVKSYSQQKSPWVEVCHWIKEHTEGHVTFITPPTLEGFTYLSGRSTIVDFKVSPDGGQFLAEWNERLSEVVGHVSKDKDFVGGGLLSNRYLQLDELALVRLARKYKAAYAVLPLEKSCKFPVLYQNEGYKVVRLPI